MLTDKAIRAAVPRDKPYRLTDGRGLTLVVHPNGSRYWRLRYRIHGKEKLLAIGTYPRVTLAKARKAAEHARGLLEAGTDPVQQRREEKRQARIRVENSVEAIAREWHGQLAPRWKPHHAAYVLRTLERDVFPLIGHRPIAEVSPGEVLDTVKAVEQREALDQAKRLLQRVAAVFRYAVQTGRASSNPAAELSGVLKTMPVTHRPALPVEQLPEFLVALDRFTGHPLTRLAIELLLLTWCRPGEVRGARWEEIDIEAEVWRIPADRMKMQTDHIIPLSPQALRVIEQVQVHSSWCELLFPNRQTPRKSISENTMNRAIGRMGFSATPHGFRALASTIANEQTDFSADAIEKALSHVERNKVRAAYHRAEYLDERRRLLAWWADFLDRQRAIGRGDNVVSIPMVRA